MRALVFLLAFIPRALYEVSRPVQWYERSIQFWDALLAGDLAGTFQHYHPGVTVMWLSGGAMRLFAWLNGLTSAQLLGSDAIRIGLIDAAVEVGVLPLALVIALCTALSYSLLSRIGGRSVAVIGCCLLALDPFYLAKSKELHLNGLLTAFMFTSVLFLLSHLSRPKRSHLILSGAFAGLSMLTKTPALFLVPYAIFASVFRALLISLEEDGRAQGWVRAWVRRSWTALRSLLLWGAVAALAIVALWPALWVEPANVLRGIADSLVFHVGTAHPNPQFFAGEATFEDPGPAFYLATMAWKLTPITLAMALLGLLAGLVRPRRWEHGWVVWLLAAYVMFYTAQMALAEYKQISYVLPVFPALDLVAACGVAVVARALCQLNREKACAWLSAGVLCVALGLQAAVVLPHHPYYGTVHNLLLGGSRGARQVLPLQDEGEGLDLAAQFLNTMPRAERSRAKVDNRGEDIFRRIFVGATVKEKKQDDWATYRVYSLNTLMRGTGSQAWHQQMAADLESDPLWSVAFDGVTYVWVYGAPPAAPAAGGPEREIGARLGDHIWLEKVRISSNVHVAGDTLVIVPIWTSDGQVSQRYSVFCHVMSSEGRLVAKKEGTPIGGVRPTGTWGVDEVIEDGYEIYLAPTLSPGEYELSVGMVDVASLERLPAYGADGMQLPEDRIVVGTVRVVEAAASGG